MAWTGIVEAQPLVIAPCGLLSVARVVDHLEDEHWLSGFNVETNGFPTVSLRTQQDVEIDDGEGVIYDGSESPTSYEATPFFIELKAKKTSLDFLREGQDLSPTMVKQIQAVAQKAIERELWEGAATRNAVPDSEASFLRRSTASGGAEVVTTGGGDAERALWRIEQAISNSPTGGRGVIHMTRDVASALDTRLRYVEKDVIDERTFAVTRLGTPVVIGSGYTGNGPIGTAGADASPTNKWIYVTGGVQVDLGKPLVISASTPSTNDHEALISLGAAVHFDPSVFAAAQVTLP